MGAQYSVASDERERLILEYLPKVRWIAAGIHERLPAGTLEEDLVSTGLLGLINAIDNFDPERNVALWTYAEHKIRGAILDSVRELDGVPAHKRKYLKQVQGAVSTAQQRLGRAATEEEVAMELSVTLSEYRKMLSGLQGITLSSLESPVARQDSGSDLITLARCVADPRAESPADILERSELHTMLAQGIEALPDLERHILQLYFVEELTLMEVGEVVSLHYSRVSQLKTQAMARLRAYLQHRTRTPQNG